MASHVDDRVTNHGETDGPAAADRQRGRPTSPPFIIGSETFRLRHFGAVWDPNWHEEPVAPMVAAQIVDAALRHYAGEPLARYLEEASAQLRGVHPGGTWVLVRLRPALSSAVGPSAATPAALRPRSSVPESPTVEEPGFGDLFAAAQAVALKEAAAAGVPFCEECARARGQQTAAAG